MKRIISALSCLLLLMTLASPAAFASQAPQDVNIVIVDHSNPLLDIISDVTSTATAHDTVYILVEHYDDSSVTFEYWTPGMEQFLPLEGEALTFNAYDDAGNPKETNVSKLFSDGKCIYGYDDQSRNIRKLVDENGNRTATDALYTLGATEDGSVENLRSDEGIGKFFAQDGVLYVEKYVPSLNGYVYVPQMYDLETGKLLGQLDVKNMQEIFPYKDSKLLFFSYDEESSYDAATGTTLPMDLAIYDTATKTTEIIGKCHSNSDNSVAYNEENHSAYFVSGTTVYSFQNMQAPFQVSAFLPVQTWNDTNAAVFSGGLFVTIAQNMLLARGLDQPGLEDGALTIVGGGNSMEHIAFMQHHPGQVIALSSNSFSSFTEIAAAMISGEDAFDIISLSSSYHPIERMIDKGYAADLSGYPDMMEIVAQMDPDIVDFLMRDGKLYGVPTGANSSGIGIVRGTMEAIGITQDDLPTTYLEFLDFIANYQADYGEDHEEFNLFDMPNIKSYLLSDMLISYIALAQQESDEISFDTPLLRKLFAAFEKIDFAEFDAYEQIDEFYAKQFLFTFSASYSYPSEYTQDSYTFPLILPLDEGMEAYAPLVVTVMTINPRTTRMDQAAFYLSEYMKNYEYNLSFVLFPDHNDPVENPNFDQQMEPKREELKQLKASLETADPENKADIQESIKVMQDYLEASEEGRMLITADQIVRFRETASPYFATWLQIPLTASPGGANSELTTFMNLYLEKAIDSEGFIRELDNRMTMMRLED